jgi:hypothetical protein
VVNDHHKKLFMKISKHIFLYIISLSMVAYGITISQICIGAGHSDSDIEWASHCHSQSPALHHSEHPAETSFGHNVNDCIDISIQSIAASGGSNIRNTQLNNTKITILKPNALHHPFFSIDFSKLKPNFFPFYTDITFLSIASTILIV